MHHDDRGGPSSEFLRRFGHTNDILEAITDGGGDKLALIDTLAKTINEIAENKPVLVLVDTFERAQQYGETVVRDFWAVMKTLVEMTPSLRMIVAGRVDSYGLFQNTVPMVGFESPEETKTVLERTSGAELDVELAAAVHEISGGRPLTVRLAGILFRGIGPAKLADPAVRVEALLKVSASHAEATLHNRIIGQIPDTRLQALGTRALLLRRVTPGIFHEVIGPVARLDLSVAEADDLFVRYESVVDLVDREYADWGEPTLIHRPEVRTPLVQDLRQGDEEELAELDRRAIKFFCTKEGNVARAEEIYHALWTDASEKELAARWLPGVTPHLVNALEEVPKNRRPFLADMLGVDLPKSSIEDAQTAEWERHAVRSAAERLARSDPQGAIKVLAQRADRSSGSALYAIEADALHRLGRFDEALAVIEAGLASASDGGARRQAGELFIVRALLRERRRRFAAASKDADEARMVGSDLRDRTLELRAIAALLRLHRKSSRIAGPTAEQLATRANALLDEIGDESLFGKPALMRALAAELGPLRPELVCQATMVHGGESLPERAPETDTVMAQVARDIGSIVPTIAAWARVDGIIEGTDMLRPGELEKIVSVAADSGRFELIAGPVAKSLSAEIDQLVGAFPSASLLGRKRTWWP